MIIQKIIFPKTRIQSVKNMYYLPVFGDIRFVNGVLTLKPESKISFNSYFNSFYETYWHEYAELDLLKIKIKVQGSGILAVFRDSLLNGCYELVVYDFDSQNLEELEFSVDLSDLLYDKGRIFIDITAFSNVDIHEISIASERDVRKNLSIGLCTFNREDFLYKNLVSLVELSKEFKSLKKVFVVNQGNDFSNPKLLDLLSENKNLFEVYKQGNLGGAGGFTRTMYEAINTDGLDYHLLMDDDVIIESDVIQTAFAFACLAKKPIAVGGQMLDLLRPNILHEYGAIVDNSGYIRPVLHNLNVGDAGSLHVFKKVNKIDYNAWWFCMVPVEAIKNINLPAPIFIRGDDEEYGLRLKANGIETVGLPGVGLWHEPFYVKVAGWQTYYDFRNRMILSSSYKDMKLESSNRLFLRIYNLLLCHDYQSVKLILEAIKDFAKGTKLFSEGSEAIHAKVSKIAKDYMPKSLEVNFKPVADDAIAPKWDSKTRRINFAKQTAKLATMDFSKKPVKHLWDRHISPQNIDCHPYVKSNGIQSYHYLYSPNRAVFQSLLKEIAEARYLYAMAVKNNDWHSIDKNKQESYWQNIFYGS